MKRSLILSVVLASAALASAVAAAAPSFGVVHSPHLSAAPAARADAVAIDHQAAADAKLYCLNLDRAEPTTIEAMPLPAASVPVLVVSAPAALYRPAHAGFPSAVRDRSRQPSVRPWPRLVASK